MKRLLVIHGTSQTVRLALYTLLGFLAFRIANASGVAIVLGIGTIVAPAAALYLGRATDKLGYKPILMYLPTLAAISLLVLPSLDHSLIGLAAISLWLGLTEAGEAPAARVALVSLSGGALLQSNSRLVAVANIGYGLGPLLAGTGIAAVGVPATCLALAILLMICALLALSLPPIESQVPIDNTQWTPAIDPAQASSLEPAGLIDAQNNDEQEEMYKERSIWQILAQVTLAKKLIISSAILYASYGLMIPGEVALADLFGGGSLAYALLVSAWGVGSTLGALISASNKADEGLLRTVRIGILLYALFAVVAGLAPTLPVAIAAMFLAGAYDARAQAAGYTLLAMIIPYRKLGTVMGASQGAGLAAMAGAIIIGGLLIDATSVRLVYLLSALVALASYLALSTIKAKDITPDR